MKAQHLKTYDEESLSDSDRFGDHPQSNKSSCCCKIGIVILLLLAVGGAVAGYVVATGKT